MKIFFYVVALSLESLPTAALRLRGSTDEDGRSTRASSGEIPDRIPSFDLLSSYSFLSEKESVTSNHYPEPVLSEETSSSSNSFHCCRRRRPETAFIGAAVPKRCTNRDDSCEQDDQPSNQLPPRHTVSSEVFVPLNPYMSLPEPFAILSQEFAVPYLLPSTTLSTILESPRCTCFAACCEFLKRGVQRSTIARESPATTRRTHPLRVMTHCLGPLSAVSSTCGDSPRATQEHSSH